MNISESDNQLPLVVKIRGVDCQIGSIRIGLFNSKAQFERYDPRKPVEDQGELYSYVQIKAEQAVDGILVHRFTNIPDGEYAIAAFHDQNENGRLDSNRIGAPTEMYGFSNDARKLVGLPDYRKAKFFVTHDCRLIEFGIKK